MTEIEKTYYSKEEWDSFTTEKRHEIEKIQLFDHLAEAGIEATEFFLKQVEKGQIEGHDYWDDESDCGCVLGTLMFGKEGESAALSCDTEDWESAKYYAPLSKWQEPDTGLSVVEILAYNLSPGDTPENNENARLLRDWTKEWLDSQRVAS